MQDSPTSSLVFFYDHDTVKTTDTLQISVADLRDLIQAANLKADDKLNEYSVIIEDIERKNRLQKKSLGAKKT